MKTSIRNKKVDITLGSVCNKCQKELKKFEPQFFCYFCQIHFCRLCGHLIDETKRGSYKYVHPHALAWINITKEEGLINLDEYKFGRKLIFEADNKQFLSVCNGCKLQIKDNRYICFKCKPGPIRTSGFLDLCEKCIEILEKKDENDEKYKKLSDALDEWGHDPSEHILLRISVSGGNYYRY